MEFTQDEWNGEMVQVFYDWKMPLKLKGTTHSKDLWWFMVPNRLKKKCSNLS